MSASVSASPQSDRAWRRVERLFATRREPALALARRFADRWPEDLRFVELYCRESTPSVEAWMAAPRDVSRVAADCLARLPAQRAPWWLALAGRLREALDAIEVDGVDESDVTLLVAVGVAGLRADDVDAAFEALEHARRVRPLDPAVLRWLGVVELSRGDADRAVAYLQRSWVLEHRDETVADWVGALLAAGRCQDAVVQTTGRCERVTERTWGRLCTAVYAECGDLERATVASERWLAVDPSALPLIARGDLRRRAGDIEGARAAYSDALRRDPSSIRARRALEGLGP